MSTKVSIEGTLRTYEISLRNMKQADIQAIFSGTIVCSLALDLADALDLIPKINKQPILLDQPAGERLVLYNQFAEIVRKGYEKSSLFSRRCREKVFARAVTDGFNELSYFVTGPALGLAGFTIYNNEMTAEVATLAAALAAQLRRLAAK